MNEINAFARGPTRDKIIVYVEQSHVSAQSRKSLFSTYKTDQKWSNPDNKRIRAVVIHLCTNAFAVIPKHQRKRLRVHIKTSISILSLTIRIFIKIWFATTLFRFGQRNNAAPFIFVPPKRPSKPTRKCKDCDKEKGAAEPTHEYSRLNIIVK